MFTAKLNPSTGDYVLKVDGREFGRLSNCEVAHVFTSNDQRLMDNVNIEGGMSIREMLAEVKRAYNALETNDIAEAKHEQACEKAYYNTIEYDAEALAEMEMEDVMGLT